LTRLSAFSFPIKLTDTTRAYFERTAQMEGGQFADDLRAVLSGQSDPAAAPIMRLSANAFFSAQLRTTCVATMLEGGSAINALPQLVSAKVNCRVIPGEPAEGVKAALEKALADDQIVVTSMDSPVLSQPSVLSDQIIGPITKLSAEFWPGAVVLPTMSTGATDGSYLRNAGIPTYGHSGLANDIAENRAHGRDERIQVKSFFQGGEYLYRLVKAFAGGQ
jgi:acetylornithine deacetylase/succinyl-diaminopimelate desuccinylase-like protein